MMSSPTILKHNNNLDHIQLALKIPVNNSYPLDKLSKYFDHLGYSYLHGMVMESKSLSNIGSPEGRLYTTKIQLRCSDHLHIKSVQLILLDKKIQLGKLYKPTVHSDYKYHRGTL